MFASFGFLLFSILPFANLRVPVVAAFTLIINPVSSSHLFFELLSYLASSFATHKLDLFAIG
jgi:hypothetical protein